MACSQQDIEGARVEREICETTGKADERFLQADLSLIREANRLADEVDGSWPALCTTWCIGRASSVAAAS